MNKDKVQLGQILFLEDNAEFGYGMLLATQARRERLASKMTKAFLQPVTRCVY